MTHQNPNTTSGEDIPADAWRQQVVEARRNQILEATAKVFAEKGYHRATIKEIATAAGIADGTIYNYFDGKRDLFLGLLDQLAFEPLKEVFYGKEYQTTEDLLRALLLNRVQFLRDNQHIFRSVFPEVLNTPELRKILFNERLPHFTQEVEAFITKGVQQGQLNQINPIVFTNLVLGAILTTAFMDLSGNSPTFSDVSDEELVEQWIQILYYGLLARPEAS